MANKIAVAVIHGMGAQGKTHQGIDQISYSAGLYKRLQDYLGKDVFKTQIAWREVFWADILQTRQEDYIKGSLSGTGARWNDARRFVMHNLADAASYRKTKDDDNHRIYDDIHQRVFDTIKRLQEITDENTPLIVLAHSLGGHIMSNYVYDMMKGRSETPPETDFQALKTMCGFITFGCNIPVFTFAYPPEKVFPIRRPGVNIPVEKRIDPWWLNYNDKDDALGMPLGNLSDGYRQMRADGELKDWWINVGGPVSFWNPASHNGYWTDRHFYRPVGSFLKKALKIGPV